MLSNLSQMFMMSFKTRDNMQRLLKMRIFTSSSSMKPLPMRAINIISLDESHSHRLGGPLPIYIYDDVNNLYIARPPLCGSKTFKNAFPNKEYSPRSQRIERMFKVAI